MGCCGCGAVRGCRARCCGWWVGGGGGGGDVEISVFQSGHVPLRMNGIVPFRVSVDDGKNVWDAQFKTKEERLDVVYVRGLVR